MLDERLVSWKILLPHVSKQECLAIGLDAGGLAGLARTWNKIDCVVSKEVVDSLKGLPTDLRNKITVISTSDNIKQKYRTVVLASQQSKDVINISQISQLLTNDGIMVCMGFSKHIASQKDLLKAGFQQLHYYSALPWYKPRVFIPTNSRRIYAKGLAFHSPGSCRARWLLRIAKCINKIGWKKPLIKRALIIAQRTQGQPNREDFKHWLSGRLGCKIVDLIIYCGSDSPRRKITVLAVTEKRKQDLVMKIADTEQGVKAIQTETLALQILADSPLIDHVPKLVIEEDIWHGYYIQVQTPVGKNSKTQVPQLTDHHIEFLAELSRMGRKTAPIETTRMWQALEKKLGKVDLRLLPEPVIQAVRLLKENNWAESITICHRTHGDFVPWNIYCGGTHLCVIDWEDSEADGIALTDLFHFIYRQAAFVGPWPGATQLSHDFRQFATLLWAKANYPNFNYYTVLFVWMLQEYLRHPTAYLEEVFEFSLKSCVAQNV